MIEDVSRNNNNNKDITTNLVQLEDKRPIGPFLLAIAEGPSGPGTQIVSNGVLTML